MKHEIVYTTRPNAYSVQENSCNSPHRRKCIDGSITSTGKCVGYCTFYEHPGFLTKELRQEHNCVKKGCHYYSQKVKQDVESNSPFAVLLETSTLQKTYI